MDPVLMTVLAVSLVTALVLAGLAMAHLKQSKQRQKTKVVSSSLTLTNNNRRLLHFSRKKDCDYRGAIKALRPLGLVDDVGMVVLKGASKKFDAACLFAALGKYWQLRWPALAEARRNDEIYFAAQAIIEEFGGDRGRLEELMGIIERHCPDDIAESLEITLTSQLEERGKETGAKT